MTDQTQRLEIATVRAEIGSNITYRFNNDAIDAGGIPTESGNIKNLKLIIKEIEDKASVSSAIYPTVSAGLAATPEGGMFLVASSEDDEIYVVWRKVGGVAVDTGKRALSSQAAQDAVASAQSSAEASASSALDAQEAASNAAGEFEAIFEADQISREDEFRAFMDGANYESTYLIYGVGVVVERQTQLTQREGELYRVMNALDIPLTLTGTWATDAPKLQAVGDAALRQQLGSDAGMIIRYTAPIPGAVNRALIDKFMEQITVKDFGAAGNGIADDTGAFDLYVDWINSRGGDDYTNITGTRLSIGQGDFKITRRVRPIIRSGCDVKGAGEQATRLIISPGIVGAFYLGDGGATASVVGFVMSDMKIEYISTPSVGDAILVGDQAFRIHLKDIFLVNAPVLMIAGVSASRICAGITTSNITGSFANIPNTEMISLRYGAGWLATNMSTFVTGVPHPIHPASMVTSANRNLINCVAGFWDTILMANCIHERWDYGLVVSAGPGMVYQNLFFSADTTFDYFKTTVFQLSSQAGGVCSKVKHDGWATSWEGPAINITGGGYNDNHSFSGSIPIAGQEAVFYGVAGPKSNSFTGLKYGATNRISTTSESAVNVLGTATGFIIQNCDGNEDNSSVGTPWRAKHGIRIGANADDYMVTNNKMSGSVDAYYIEANTASSNKRRVSGNTQANYASVAAWPLSATNVPTYNKSPFVIVVTIAGGAGVTTISQNGVPIGGNVFTLDPGDYITVPYTSTPSSYAKTLS